MQEIIRYSQGHSSLGGFMLAASAKGLVALEFGEAVEPLVQALRQRFPDSQLIADVAGLAETVASATRLIERPEQEAGLPLDLRGSEFELRVWQALREIPAGQTSSYGAIAARLGQPRMAREVGEACAANTLAVIVPCHRVLKKSGALSGYRWGLRRKRALMEREHLAAFSLTLEASG